MEDNPSLNSVGGARSKLPRKICSVLEKSKNEEQSHLLQRHDKDKDRAKGSSVKYEVQKNKHGNCTRRAKLQTSELQEEMDRNKRLTKYIDKLKEEKASAQIRITRLITEVTENRKARQRQRTSFEKIIQGLQEQLKEKDVEANAFKSEIEKQQEEIARLSAGLAEAKCESTVWEEMFGNINSVMEQKTAEENETLREKVHQLERHTEATQAETEQLTAENSDLIVRLRLGARDCNSEAESIVSESPTFEEWKDSEDLGEQHETQTTVTDLNEFLLKEVLELTAQIDELNISVKSVIEQKETHLHELHMAQHHVQELEKEISELKSDSADLLTQLNDAHGTIGKNEDFIMKQNAKIEILQGLIPTETEKDLESLKEQNASLKVMVEDLKLANGQLGAQNSEYTLKLNDLHFTVESLQQTNDQAELTIKEKEGIIESRDNQIVRLNTILQELDVEKENLKETVSKVQKAQESLRNQNEESVSQLNKTVESLQRENGIAQVELREKDRKIENQGDNIDQLNTTIQGLILQLENQGHGGVSSTGTQTDASQLSTEGGDTAMSFQSVCRSVGRATLTAAVYVGASALSARIGYMAGSFQGSESPHVFHF